MKLRPALKYNGAKDGRDVDEIVNEMLQFMKNLAGLEEMEHMETAGHAHQTIEVLDQAIVFITDKLGKYKQTREFYQAGIENSRTLFEKLSRIKR